MGFSQRFLTLRTSIMIKKLLTELGYTVGLVLGSAFLGFTFGFIVGSMK